MNRHRATEIAVPPERACHRTDKAISRCHERWCDHRAVGIDDFRVRNDDTRGGILDELRDECGPFTFVPSIVLIAQADEVMACETQAALEGSSDAQVVRVAIDLQERRCHPSQQVKGIVCRRVVDHDQFIVRKELAHDGVDLFAKKRLTVVHGHDHGEGFHAELNATVRTRTRLASGVTVDMERVRNVRMAMIAN